QIVLPHLDAAYNLARWLVKDPTLAQDVVQDAAVRALGYFASYRGGDGRAWLLQIVRNTAYTMLSARSREVTGTFDEQAGEADPALRVADPAGDPETQLERAEDKGKLDRALAALPTELRECLVLRELEELSYKQVAQVTGVPIGTVMSRLWRARRALMQASAERGRL
ncbi:MAG: sigma-70 family RNA polymerase sigma factor, partial [Acetobacteraceae bacterium]|nr:sigma-70 family RNA polymerase sigma factor [Acetobacteraceae bacterium]